MTLDNRSFIKILTCPLSLGGERRGEEGRGGERRGEEGRGGEREGGTVTCRIIYALNSN